jgi:hypothetical protein
MGTMAMVSLIVGGGFFVLAGICCLVSAIADWRDKETLIVGLVWAMVMLAGGGSAWSGVGVELEWWTLSW